MINIYTANIVNSVNIYNLFENIFFYAKQKQALVDKPDGRQRTGLSLSKKPLLVNGNGSANCCTPSA